MVTGFDKAIVGLLTAVLAVLAAFNIQLSWATPEMVGIAGGVISGLLVFLVPNKKT